MKIRNFGSLFWIGGKIGLKNDQTMQYINPKDKYTKAVYFPKIWTFIFGPLYFLIHGVWRHILGYAIGFYLTMFLLVPYLMERSNDDPFDFFFCLFMFQLTYALCARRILHNSYMRKGWEPLHSPGDALVGAGTAVGILSFLWNLITKKR